MMDIYVHCSLGRSYEALVQILLQTWRKWKEFIFSASLVKVAQQKGGGAWEGYHYNEPMNQISSEYIYGCPVIFQNLWGGGGDFPLSKLGGHVHFPLPSPLSPPPPPPPTRFATMRSNLHKPNMVLKWLCISILHTYKVD